MEYVLTIILTLALPGMDDRKITESISENCHMLDFHGL